VSLSGIHCGTHRGPDSVCVKAPFPLDHPGFLIRHSQAMWRLLKRRIFTKYLTSNGKYMYIKGFTSMPVLIWEFRYSYKKS